MKRCSGCKEWKEYTEFSRNRTRKDGYSHRCKKCEREHQYKPNRICETCGKDFYAAEALIKRGDGRFCSIKCSSASRDRKVEVTCEICGKQFTVHAYRITYGQGRFCSVNCEGRWRNGENAPRWMGDNPINPDNTGHHRAIKMFSLKPCEVCAITPEEKRIIRHHRDSNPMNNAEENISFLCDKHHRQVHSKQRGQGNNGPST